MQTSIVIEAKFEWILRICVNNFNSMAISVVKVHPFMEGFIEVFIESTDEDDDFLIDLFNAGMMFGDLK